MKYCKTCLYPEAKADLTIHEDGECSACKSYKERKNIDWNAREQKLIELLSQYKGNQEFDCLVPVSGGKDSTYQVIKMIEYGMKPLAVTAMTDDLSDLGIKNLKNIGRLCPHIQINFKQDVRNKIAKIGLEELGDISYAEHLAIFTAPLRVAHKYGIKLIVWGENPQNEYTGMETEKQKTEMDRRWLEEFSGLIGLRVSDLKEYGLTDDDLYPYTYPEQEMNELKPKMIFLGQYLPWDGLKNAIISQAYGFSTFGKAVESNFVDYENLDNHQTGLRDYFKWLKFGYGRATDIACNLIRRGIITRKEGLEIVKRRDSIYPEYCLDKHISKILKPLGVTQKEYDLIADRFINTKILEGKVSDRTVRLKHGIN